MQTPPSEHASAIQVCIPVCQPADACTTTFMLNTVLNRGRPQHVDCAPRRDEASELASPHLGCLLRAAIGDALKRQSQRRRMQGLWVIGAPMAQQHTQEGQHLRSLQFQRAAFVDHAITIKVQHHAMCSRRLRWFTRASSSLAIGRCDCKPDLAASLYCVVPRHQVCCSLHVRP